MLLLCATVGLVSCGNEDDPTKVPVSGITLNKTTLLLSEGAKESPIATVAPADADNKSVTWTSSASDVATVSETGEITAIKAGTAVITVASVADNTKKATCALTVMKISIPVTGITLNKTNLSLTEGAKESLIATVAPANADIKSVTWTSSATDVATVSETGEITAVKAGTAVITVTSVADNSKKATCSLTVTSKTIPVTGVTLNKVTLTLKKGAKETLIATVSPANADNRSIMWSSSATDVATVSATGEVAAVKAGTTTITVTSLADNSKKATCTVTVTADVLMAAIGDYYYSDNTCSSSLDKAKTCVGIVFWVDPTDASKGKIVSLDGTKQNWSAVQTWKSSKTLPAGMIWYLPSKDELQYLYCSYVGVACTTWGEGAYYPLVDNKEKMDAFDKKLRDAGGQDIVRNYHWSSTLDGEYPSTVFVGGTGNTSTSSTGAAENYARVISVFK